METAREKFEKQWFVSFFDESAWSRFDLRFNIGTKHKLPVKFFAQHAWRSQSAPSLFASPRGDFQSVAAAERYMVEQLAKDGGTVHVPTAQLLARLRKEHGYDG